MNLQQAMKWADDNAQGEAVDRLRSRKVAKVLAATVRTYAAWIREEGERNNTCTFNVLGEVCGYCECKRKPLTSNVTGTRGIIARLRLTEVLGHGAKNDRKRTVVRRRDSTSTDGAGGTLQRARNFACSGS